MCICIVVEIVLLNKTYEGLVMDLTLFLGGVASRNLIFFGWKIKNIICIFDFYFEYAIICLGKRNSDADKLAEKTKTHECQLVGFLLI